VELTVEALRAYLHRVDGMLLAAYREALRARAAERLGIARTTWEAILAGNLDGARLREIHRAVTGERSTIRYAQLDGGWAIAPARAGHLRSRPQSFRAGEHVEAAWDHTTLKRRLAELLNGTAAAFACAPVMCAAQLIWSLTRAQPFAGDNERVALIAVSRLLHGAGLPTLAVTEIMNDPAFEAAVSAATADDREELECYLATAIWDEALALAEVLTLPASIERWSLRDEHLALDQARRRARTIAQTEVEALASTAADAIAARVGVRLGLALGDAKRSAPSALADRLRLAMEAVGRGHPVCPHLEISEQRWSVDGPTGLALVVMIASPGRGITGAVSIQAALELRGVPTPWRSPALLFVPDEPPSERNRRLSAWIPRAMDRMLQNSPIRC
jgi:hypothetical protein